MRHFTQKIVSVLLSAALLCSMLLVSGCKKTAVEEDPNSDVSAASTANSSAASSAAQSTQSSPENSDTSSEATSSTTDTSSSAQQSSPVQSEPHFSFSHDPALETPTGVSFKICSLSDALGRFSEISSKTAEGSPEEIVKTLLERNILCFAAMQGKCWTSSGTSGVVPIQSGYLTSVEQMETLFANTYTENQAWRLMHPQEAGGYGNVFQKNDNGELCFQIQHLRKNHGESFSTETYAAIIEANDSEITFGRYYGSTPSGGAEPNNMHFKAIKENGAWRLDTYITDAPGFVPQYTNLIQTNRVGSPELMELAKEQVGNIGGRKYWEWYGFNYHIEWCAAFVSWCYAQAGKKEPFFTGCYTGAEWFKERDQWGDKDYPDIAPGDAIFFDWNLDGDADHVGLVLGTDGANVYTIEGNRDDICITRGYSRTNYKWILGYGLMNW